MSRIIKFLLALCIIAAPTLADAQFTDQRTWAPTSGGTANAQTVAIPNVSGPPLGVVFRFIPQFTNTGATTFNINGTGAKPVRKPSPAGPVALIGGEVVASQIVAAMYDGSNYQLVSNLNATASQVVPNPGGYLTPCTQVGTPATGCATNQIVPTGNVVGATTLFYTPVSAGAQVPIWNGSQYVPFAFTEMTLTLGTSNLANTIYDACIFSNAGTPTIVTSVAWSSSAAGASSRGTGAGTAQITRTNGFPTNAVAITGRNGANTYSIPANQCLIVGSIFMDGTNGQVSLLPLIGQSRKYGVYNFFNQKDITLQAATGAAWNIFAGVGLRAANNDGNNNLTVFTGNPDSTIPVSYVVSYNANLLCGAGISLTYISAIGFNTTGATVGTFGFGLSQCSNGGTTFAAGNGGNTVARYLSPPLLGVNSFFALENITTNSSGGATINSPNSMMLTATYKG